MIREMSMPGWEMPAKQKSMTPMTSSFSFMMMLPGFRSPWTRRGMVSAFFTYLWWSSRWVS